MSIIKNITREEYNELEGTNASLLKGYYESSLNGNYESSKERVETPAMSFGTASHSMILEPLKFKEIYKKTNIPTNESTGKEYGSTSKVVKDYFASLPDGEKYLTSAEFKTLEQMASNIKQNKPATMILDKCQDRELAMTWTDEESGIECKALIDFADIAGKKIAGDYKTIKDIKFRDSNEAIAKSLMWELVGNKNLLQFAFYFDGLRANGIDIERFAVIFAQNNGNCEVLTAWLGDKTLQYGRDMYSRAILNYVNKDKNESAFSSIIEI